jgi:hypothetical protein
MSLYFHTIFSSSHLSIQYLKFFIISYNSFLAIISLSTVNHWRFNSLGANLSLFLASIKHDDMLIQREVVASLSEHELRQACRERGHLALLTVKEMREEVIS